MPNNISMSSTNPSVSLCTVCPEVNTLPNHRESTSLWQLLNKILNIGIINEQVAKLRSKYFKFSLFSRHRVLYVWSCSCNSSQEFSESDTKPDLQATLEHAFWVKMPLSSSYLYLTAFPLCLLLFTTLFSLCSHLSLLLSSSSAFSFFFLFFFSKNTLFSAST